MHSPYRFISSLFLAAALIAPPGIMAATRQPAANAQDEHHEKSKRYYDKEHKEYHNWDEKEDRAYRQYLKEQNKEYREFDKLQRNDQQAYWHWRHDHPDHD